LTDWANAIEGREDIRLEPNEMNVLKEYINDFANPSLIVESTQECIGKWKRYSIA
jgi:hypothetical protein